MVYIAFLEIWLVKYAIIWTACADNTEETQRYHDILLVVINIIKIIRYVKIQ